MLCLKSALLGTGRGGSTCPASGIVYKSGLISDARSSPHPSGAAGGGFDGPGRARTVAHRARTALAGAMRTGLKSKHIARTSVDPERPKQSGHVLAWVFRSQQPGRRYQRYYVPGRRSDVRGRDSGSSPCRDWWPVTM